MKNMYLFKLESNFIDSIFLNICQVILIIIVIAFPSKMISQNARDTVTETNTSEIVYVNADSCDWIIYDQLFSPNKRVYIEAEGEWYSKNVKFSYYGGIDGTQKTHQDSRSPLPNSPVMSLLVRIQYYEEGGVLTTNKILSFGDYTSIDFTFKKFGKISFLCNDDITNPNHCGDNSGSVEVSIDFLN